MTDRTLAERGRSRTPKCGRASGSASIFSSAAWVDKVIRAIARRTIRLPRDRAWPRRADPCPLAATARRVLAVEIDRDLAAELRASAPPNVTRRRRRFPGSHHGPSREHRWRRAERSRPDPRGRQPAVQRRVADPVQARRAARGRRAARRCDGHAAARGRRSADGVAGHRGLRRADRPDRPVGRRSTRLLALPPGAFRPAPKVHSAVVRLRFHSPEPPVAGTAHVRKRWSRRCSRGGGKRSPTRSRPRQSGGDRSTAGAADGGGHRRPTPARRR